MVDMRAKVDSPATRVANLGAKGLDGPGTAAQLAADFANFVRGLEAAPAEGAMKAFVGAGPSTKELNGWIAEKLAPAEKQAVKAETDRLMTLIADMQPRTTEQLKRFELGTTHGMGIRPIFYEPEGGNQNSGFAALLSQLKTEPLFTKVMFHADA